MLTCLVHAIYLPEPFNHEEVYQHPPRLEMNIFILRVQRQAVAGSCTIRPQLLRTGIDVVHCPELVFLFLSNIPAFVRTEDDEERECAPLEQLIYYCFCFGL
jgi:hypothetical protein